MGALDWGDVARFLVGCAGAGGSLVAAFWGLMRLFRPMAEAEATKATDRLYDRLRQHDFPELGDRVGRMDDRIDQRFDRFEKRLDQRFDGLEKRFDQRFDEVDRRFEEVDRRFEEVDRRFDRVDKRFDRIEESLTGLRETVREDRVAILAAIDGLAATEAAGAARRETVGRGAVAQG